MDSYTLNTVNYNYKTLSHEGFGGVCKYIATPKRVGYSRLLVKHENIQSACNTFMCSRPCRTVRCLYAESLSHEHKQ